LYSVIQFLVRLIYAYCYVRIINNNNDKQLPLLLIDANFLAGLFINIGTYGLSNFKILNPIILKVEFYREKIFYTVLVGFLFSFIFDTSIEFWYCILICFSVVLNFEILVLFIQNNLVQRYQIGLSAQMLSFLFFLYFFELNSTNLIFFFTLSYLTIFILVPPVLLSKVYFSIIRQFYDFELRELRLLTFLNFYKFYFINNLIGLFGWFVIPFLFRTVYFDSQVDVIVDYEISLKLTFLFLTIISVAVNQAILKYGAIKGVVLKIFILFVYLGIITCFIFIGYFRSVLTFIHADPNLVTNDQLVLILQNGLFISMLLFFKLNATKIDDIFTANIIDILILFFILSISMLFIDMSFNILSYMLWVMISVGIFFNFRGIVKTKIV
jgi:hypothetical protein